ncbi:MAG: phosphoribosylamine--glycine ligase [Methylacidiphilales bacterium]|nr:phosphoribosylamine--glycine ligase [Candidatus Methylacidiphilales bacterium]MDW8349569.1 phosphoribosylamine--glycine ligase [Verrucomicrobiae bacterium]
MKILIIGQGAREHAIAHFLSHPHHSLYIAPGNPGTESIATSLPYNPDQIDSITTWAAQHRPDLAVIGPELPLSLGLADRLRALNIPTVGPDQSAARLETSKTYCKELLTQAHIPTPPAIPCTDLHSARSAIRQLNAPYVIKADGLAAGKGVFLPKDNQESDSILDALFNQRILGSAADKVLIEKRIEGREISIIALTDGTTLRYLPPAQDYKRLYDHHLGPNTGGMGAYAPAPWLTPSILETIHHTIFTPLLQTLQHRSISYRGILYAGLMITDQGPQVLEFNVRLGDPETQAILPLIATPLDELFHATANAALNQIPLRLHPARASTAIVIAAEGYPHQPTLHTPITLPTVLPPSTAIFHAGTRRHPDGTLRVAAGRILTATAWAQSLREARETAYALARSIQIPKSHYRKDIAQNL